LLAGIAIGVVLGGLAVLVFRPVEPTASPDPTAARKDVVTPVEIPRRATDPESRPASLADIARMPSEFAREIALYDLLRSAGVARVESLLDEADALPPAHQTNLTKDIIYSRFAELDPRAAVARIRASGGSDERQLARVMRAWATVDIDAAMAFVETLAGQSRERAANALLSLDLSHTLLDEIAARFAVEEALRIRRAEAQARVDPAAAWQDAVARDPNSWGLWSIAEIWMTNDPESALQAIGALTNRLRREELLRSAVTRWAQDDYHAALDWLLAHPNARLRRDLLSTVAHVRATESPREVFDFARTLDRAEGRVVALAGINALSQTDPQAALAVLEDFADPWLMGHAVGNILWHWSQSDAVAALEWIDTQASTPQRTFWTSSTLGTLAET